MSPATAAAILDIDGTLVDSNYHHAIAWYRAFCRHDVVLPMWRIHHRPPGPVTRPPARRVRPVR